MAKLNKQRALSAAEVDQLQAGAVYYSCTACNHSRRFWRKAHDCPVWKCDKKFQNCPRVGNKCPEFSTRPGTMISHREATT